VCDLLEWQMETNHHALGHLKQNQTPVKRWVGLISSAFRCQKVSGLVCVSISIPIAAKKKKATSEGNLSYIHYTYRTELR